MALLKSLTLQATATQTHAFIALLNSRKQLLRCYTQNIDSLEKPLNVPLVQLHGDLDTCICSLCAHTCEFDSELIAAFDRGDTRSCPVCTVKNEARILNGKRPISTGCLRPNIVLYNEHHKQGDEIAKTHEKDLKKRPDCLIVMGTSLKIVGVKRLVKDFAFTVKNNGGSVILINKTALSKDMMDLFDHFVQLPCDEVVAGIEDIWTNMDKERAQKKKALQEKKQKLAIKKEKELKATRPITTMLKQQKRTLSDKESTETKDALKVQKQPVDKPLKGNTQLERNTPSKQEETKRSTRVKKQVQVVVPKENMLKRQIKA
jgi:NAD-dependent histone deacetylase SIR2